MSLPCSGSGSSPLTRGKHLADRVHELTHGLIPAHAGKTPSPPYKPASPKDHPRSRGEDSRVERHGRWTGGSSPFTRGKQERECVQALTHGIIPAHAGKTRPESRRPTGSRDHPRSRGENMPSAVSTGSYTGSSPLTRGKLDQMPFHAEEIGLIPTHAGKTLMVVIMVSFCGAHPHSRGENRAFDVLSVGRMGSSPLTRGKLIDSGVGGGRGGLIPAHAGKTRTQFSIRAMQRAHPHSRGENVTRPREASVVCGSSPLTRGKQAHCLHQVVIGGLIPAHAGKTGHRTRGQTNSPAHPHSRGQNSCGHGSDPTL